MGNYKMNNIKYYFQNKKWDKIASYPTLEIVKNFSFKDSLRIAYMLLNNNEWEENLQEYAIKLLYEIRNFYNKEWESSWEYDALLGYACLVRYKHEERYEAYRRAFKKCTIPPPRLLIELARCCICPGTPPISYDEAIDLIMKALKSGAYADGIGVLSNIYSIKGDEKNKKLCLKKLEDPNQIDSPSIDPKFLQEYYLNNMIL